MSCSLNLQGCKCALRRCWYLQRSITIAPHRSRWTRYVSKLASLLHGPPLGVLKGRYLYESDEAIYRKFYAYGNSVWDSFTNGSRQTARDISIGDRIVTEVPMERTWEILQSLPAFSHCYVSRRGALYSNIYYTRYPDDYLADSAQDATFVFSYWARHLHQVENYAVYGLLGAGLTWLIPCFECVQGHPDPKWPPILVGYSM